MLNFSSSTTYFLDPDSWLLSPIASEVPCSTLFPAVYQTHQGWISVTPDINQAPPPEPLPISPPRRTDDVFRHPDYNQGGVYQSSTLDAMQDFLLTPLLREAVTYKLASQVYNLRPENDHALGPLDLFPDRIAATADWRNLLFGGWWSWLEKWGRMVSIFIGLYYLYVLGRWVLTTFFSMRVLYQEHGFGANLLWGLGPARNLFPMRFYRRWRRSKPPTDPTTTPETTRDDSEDHPHEYLAIHEVGRPPLPRRNRAVSNVYPPLPAKSSSTYSNDPRTLYAEPGRRAAPTRPLGEKLYSVRDLRPVGRLTKRTSLLLDPPTEATLPASDALPPGTSMAPPSMAANLVGLPEHRPTATPRSPGAIFPTGPIGDVMKRAR